MEVQYKYTIIDGEFKLPTVKKENVDDLRAKFKARPDDVTVVTYPKSGTTWMQHIVKLIRSGGIDDPKVSTIFPWMDVSNSSKMEAVESPRYMLSHFKYSSFPGVLEPSENPGKFIYVARNPKDVAVSYYHHTHAFEVYEYNGDWNDFFSRFYTGEICEGDWFDHVLGWWKHRDCENIMFIKYEDMKKDLKGAISQIADFIGYDLDQATIDRIYEQTTFKSMKGNPNTNFTTNSIYKRRDVCQEFIRKGIVGDWMTMFTVAQSHMFDEKYQRLMEGTGLTFDFGNVAN